MEIDVSVLSYAIGEKGGEKRADKKDDRWDVTEEEKGSGGKI